MPTEESFEKAWNTVQTLAKTFAQNSSHYLSNEYQEAEVRQDFIDKFYKALGWDVGHDIQQDPYRREVRIEKPEKKSKGRATTLFLLPLIFGECGFLSKPKDRKTTSEHPTTAFTPFATAGRKVCRLLS